VKLPVGKEPEVDDWSNPRKRRRRKQKRSENLHCCWIRGFGE